MDIIGHILVNSVYGDIWVLVGGVLPDVVFIRRKSIPTRWYRFTHSLLFVLLCGVVNVGLGYGVLLHILLDIPTHGSLFSPRLLYPFHDFHFEVGKEWEYFNLVYRKALLLCVIWFLLHIIFR